MQENNNEKEEKLIDLKGTLESIIEGEGPELSQEDAIKAYKGENVTRHKRKKNSTSDDEDVEDDEHLKRLKQELLASLEKVNKLAKQLFGEKESLNLKKLKVKEKYEKAKENEQVIDKNIKIEKEGIERSREE